MRILIAEDEIALSKAIYKTLSKNNYSADIVRNGVDVLEYIESGNYDAVILNIMMPELDGLAVIRKVRANKNNIPIIVISAKAEVEDIIEGLDSGANDFLGKPFDSRELAARLRAVTRFPAVVNDPTIQCGNVSLNRATFELTGPKGKFRLANKEFQLVEMLFKNPDHIISAERFMDRIWGLETCTEMNVVWVYISYLRKKLVAIGADIRIKAIRNAGYSIEKIEE